MFSRRFILIFSFVLILPLLFLFVPRFISLKQINSIPDELDETEDLALFRRASISSVHPHKAVSRLGTTNPSAKIAFMFLTNSDISFAPLWEKFFRGNHRKFNIYIHADPSVKVTPPGGVFDGRFIAAKKTERGSPKLISAARRLIASAILDDPLNQYFALLSQHCIPLHSFHYIYSHLFPLPSSSPSLSFIEILHNETTLWDRYNARGMDLMMPEVSFEDFRGGSQFFVLSRKHALLVIKERTLWRKFRLKCLDIYSCYPEEHYFPTLLSMKDFLECSRYTLTNVNWTGTTDGHPHVYGPAEISPGLIHKLRTSNSTYSYFFARKFSPNCLRSLMKMASSVIFKD